MEPIDTNYIDLLMQETESPFTVTDDRKADWAIEKILEEVAERDRLTLIADARIKELQAQKVILALKCGKRTQFLTDKLYEYFQGVKTTDTKTQRTYKLLSGKLVLKHQQPEYVRDEQQMVAWAEASAPDFIRVKKEIAWGDLKKFTDVVGESVVLQETGEVIPGVVAKPRPDTFEVAK